MTQSPPSRRPGPTDDLASAPKQVFRNEHYTVLVDERLRLVRIVRSDKPFASIPELEATFAQLIPALDALGRARYAPRAPSACCRSSVTPNRMRSSGW